MGKIKRDFLGKEFRRLSLCAVGLAVCLAILSRNYSKLAADLPLLFLAVAVMIGLAALRSFFYARAAIGALTDMEIYLLEKEYAAPHLVYRVWQGEMHLLKNFIVCRNRGRLLLIPIHKIERVKRCFNRVGALHIPSAKFIMEAGAPVVIGFSPSHGRDGEVIFAWLAGRIGRHCEEGNVF